MKNEIAEVENGEYRTHPKLIIVYFLSHAVLFFFWITDMCAYTTIVREVIHIDRTKKEILTIAIFTIVYRYKIALGDEREI